MFAVPTILSDELNRLGEDSRRAATANPDGEGTAEIEELVCKSVHLYSRLTRRHERWANPIRQELRPFNLEDGKPWQVAFQQWADEARAILRQCSALKKRGIPIDQLETLRDNLKNCPYDGVSIDELVANSSLHGPGHGISAEELRNELDPFEFR